MQETLSLYAEGNYEAERKKAKHETDRLKTGRKAMRKERVLVLFGGHNTEYYASCDSVGGMLDQFDTELFQIYKLGVTIEGKWLLTSADPEEIRDGESWLKRKDNKKAVITPERDKKSFSVWEKEGIREIPLDCVFPLISGYGGEDGTLQGLLELANIPYVGSKVASSACSMDKQLTRIFAERLGIRQPRCKILYRDAFESREKREELRLPFDYPVFVKPASQGSSVGISRVEKETDLEKAIREAFRYEEKILIEEGIAGKELKVAVLGNEKLEMGEICEITLPEGVVNDYAAKHLHYSSIKKIPAEIPEETAGEVFRQAEAIYKALDCRGFARVDFFLDPSGTLYFNEINTVPGIGSHSIYAAMFEKKGITLKNVLTRLIRLAQEDAKRAGARRLIYNPESGKEEFD